MTLALKAHFYQNITHIKHRFHRAGRTVDGHGYALRENYVTLGIPKTYKPCFDI